MERYPASAIRRAARARPDPRGAGARLPMPWLDCPTLQARLQRVEYGLQEAVRCEAPFATEICAHLVRAGGKRLRPALVLLAAQFGNQDHPRLLSMAAAMELLHIATLYHDDVVDEATTRRQVPSANARWGNPLAVLAGSYLFARAAEIFASAGDEVNQIASQAIAQVWQGQMLETEGAYNLDLDPGRYFETIEKKTATFYELPCRLGALVSGAPPEQVQCLARYGRSLGIAFQLADDVLDIVADETLLRKPPGTDLQEGIYTLPIIYALETGDDSAGRLRAILARMKLNPGEVAQAIALLRSHPAIDRTIAVAGAFIRRARQELDSLPGGMAKESLSRLADFIHARTARAGASPPGPRHPINLEERLA